MTKQPGTSNVSVPVQQSEPVSSTDSTATFDESSRVRARDLCDEERLLDADRRAAPLLLEQLLLSS